MPAEAAALTRRRRSLLRRKSVHSLSEAGQEGEQRRPVGWREAPRNFATLPQRLHVLTLRLSRRCRAALRFYKNGPL